MTRYRTRREGQLSSLGGRKIRAWHFTDGMFLRDGQPLVVGKTYTYAGWVKLCESGLHASKRPIDALQYAPGNVVSRVECGGEMLNGDDKLVCTERTVLWAYDAEKVLRHFARLCALDVIHSWDAPTVVVQYLRTGDESLRDAAWWAAAWDAARDDAAGVAAWDARDAAWAAARDAWDAWVAAGAAARDAGDAAGDAARAAARAAVGGAAWAAARGAARGAQNKRLVRMLREGRPR